MLEKAYNGIETVFEFAICHSCIENLHSELSEKSLRTIENYMEERINYEVRRELMLEHHFDKLNPWIDRCILSGRKREDCKEYRIACMCIGDEILLDAMPSMVDLCETESLHELLSKETKDRLKDFRENVLNIPADSNVFF